MCPCTCVHARVVRFTQENLQEIFVSMWFLKMVGLKDNSKLLRISVNNICTNFVFIYNACFRNVY